MKEAAALGERRSKQEKEDKERAKKSDEKGLAFWGIGWQGEGANGEAVVVRGDEAKSDEDDHLSIAQFSTMSGCAWELFKQITRLSLLSTPSEEKVMSEVEVRERARAGFRV